MLPLPQTVAAAPKMFLLWFGFPVLPFRPWSYSVFSYNTAVLFCLPHLRGVRHLLAYSISVSFYFSDFFFFFQLFLCPFCFSLCQRTCIACICMPYLSDPVRRHVIPLSSLYTTLVCSISVSWFCDYRAWTSLGGRISTDTGCAGCRRVERTV